MKKFLSLALTLSLLITTLSTVLVGTAMANTTDTTTATYFGDAYFEDTGIWSGQTHTANGSHGWSDTADANIKATLQTKQTKKSTQGLLLSGTNWVYHKATLPTLQAAATYRLTFSYYSTGSYVGNGVTDILRRVGVYAKAEATKTNGGWYLNGENGSTNGYLNFLRGDAYAGYTTTTGLRSNPAQNKNHTKDAPLNTWNTVEMLFRTDVHTSNLYLIIEKTIGGNNLYLDDISLEMVTKATLGTWSRFTSGVVGTGSATSSASSVSEVNTSGLSDLSNAEDVDDDGKVLQMTKDTYAQLACLQLFLEKNTYYELSFYIQAPSLSDNRFVSHIGVVKDGSAYDTTTSGEFLSYVTTASAVSQYKNKTGTFATRTNSGFTAGQWRRIDLRFYSGSIDFAWLYLRGIFNNANVYIDAVQIQEAAAMDFSENWKVTAMPSTNETKYYNTCTDVTGGAYSVTENTMVYNSALDAAPIGLKVDAYAQYAFTEIAVEPGQYYDLEFYYYADTTDPAALGNNRMFSYVAVAEPDAKIHTGAVGNLAYLGDAIAINGAQTNAYTIKNGIYTANGLKLANGIQTWHKMKLSFYSADNTSVMFSVRSTVQEATYNAYVYLDGISLTKANMQTSYNSEAAIRAGSNTDGSIQTNGLRTYNAIKSDWVDAADSSIVEFGSIAIREGYMERKFPTKSAPDLDMLSLVGKGVGIGVSYRSATTITGSETITSTLWENDNTDGVFATDIFTSYLTGIAAANYGDEYLVRAYAIDENDNIYYGDTASVSIFKVAQAISEENRGVEIDNAAFDAFVRDNTEAYETWCTNNQKDVGDYYTANYAN